MRRRLVITICVIFSLSVQAEELTLLFAGDAMQHLPQVNAAKHAAHTSDIANALPMTVQAYNYTNCFRFLLPYIEQSSLAVVNLETTLGGTPYRGYPMFSSPDEWYYALREAGFRCFALANNHILDRGRRGVERTLQTISSSPNMGVYLDSLDHSSRYPLMIDIGGMRIAMLNYTYGTNGIAPTQPTYVNYIDTTEILADISAADRLGADLKIVFVHWGNEYQTKANAAQRELAKWLAIAGGIDVIIGSHPHVVQDAEWLTIPATAQACDSASVIPTTYDLRLTTYDSVSVIPPTIKNVPVIYSLGNFFSNQRETHTDGGIMVEVKIDTQTKSVTAVTYLPFYIYRGSIDGVYQYYAIPTTDYLEGKFTLHLPSADEQALRRFHHNTIVRLGNLSLLQERRACPPLDFDIDYPCLRPRHATHPLWY